MRFIPLTDPYHQKFLAIVVFILLAHNIAYVNITTNVTLLVHNQF